MSKITKHHAAKLLGVSEHTISNYVKEGILGGAKGKGNVLYINEDDLKSLAKEYKMAAASEKLLKQKQEELKMERMKANEEMERLRKSYLTNNSKSFRESLAALIMNLCRVGFVHIDKKYLNVFDEFLHGMLASDIAKIHHLSLERVRQIVVSTTREFEHITSIYEKMRDYAELEAENESLKKQLSVLTKEFERKEITKNDDLKSIADLLTIKVADLNLGVRSLNTLRANRINTLDDLLKLTKDEVMKLRKLGKKSFCEIDDALHGLSLDWRKPSESDLNFYKRMLELKKNK